MMAIEAVRFAWGWTGIQPDEIVGENDFGNLMIRDEDGRYWRLCPEDLYCRVVAGNREELDVLSTSPEFLDDWHMARLVEQATFKHGPLCDGRKYCLKIPGVLGGEYCGDNLVTVPLIEQIRASGDLAKQINDLPDGSKVQLSVVD